MKKPDELVGRDSQIFDRQLARSRSAEGAALCPSDMMLCVISYWVLSGAKRRQIQQLRCCILPTKLLNKEGKLLSPLIVWGNTLVDGHNRYAILKKHPEICFSTMPLRFANREEVLAWICKNQLGRRNLTPEQKKFLIGKQYSVEHRKPGGNGNNQHTAASKKTAPEELCQIDTIPPTATDTSVRKQIAERNNVSESYVARSEKFMRGVQIMDQMIPGMQEKILSGQFKVRDADMYRLARADFPNRKQIVHEILHPEDRPAPQSSYSHYSGINYSALEVAVRRIQQDFDFLMRYLPKLPDDSYAKTETLKILKQHKAYMAQFEEMLNDKEIA